MRFIWICLLALPLIGFSESDTEALFLRRIADFWQEGEYQIAKTQMEEFIGEYPESPFSDALCAALGDLFLREKNYSNALDYYSQIQSTEFTQKVFLNRMQCLYEMQWYSTLIDECESYLEEESNLYASYFLAISLYHQCINASKDTENLNEIAEKAMPHFETLYQSELSQEIAQGYAHLCCILKNYTKATEIFLALAESDPKAKEEMLFQVALIQSEYDKNLAIETFDTIRNLGGKRAKEALFNKMVLAFEMGKYEDLADRDLLTQIPEERIGTARLFLGRSLLNIKRYEEAIDELKGYIQDAPLSDTFYAALLSLLDASYQLGDIASLDHAIDKLQANYPDNLELPKALFSRAQILKRNGLFADAKQELEKLLDQFPDGSQKPQVLFELTHLGYKAKEWNECYKKGLEFLLAYAEHDLAPFTWRYFISSSAEIAAQNPKHKPQLLSDLKLFLELPLPDIEKNEWQLLLSKTHFDLKEYDKAIEDLKTLETPNAKLLLSLCYRDGLQDIVRFTTLAEEALIEGANLVDQGQIHASIYNAYLEQENIEKAAQHLYEAFMAKAELSSENLLWLANFYYTQVLEDEGNFVLAARSASILAKCKEKMEQDPHLEEVICKLAKIYSILGKIDEAIALLEPYAFPSNEAQLILAENYEKKGIVDQATQIFDAIVLSSATKRSPVAASASLHSARLKMAQKNANLTEIAMNLKNLVLQKNFEAEPIYLEAALEYVDLAAKGNLKKRVALLKKTKTDFESKDDLLSKDYHFAREKSPRKNMTYLGYIKLMDAEILLAQARLENNAELKDKSKELLLQIVDEQVAYCLKERVRKRLANEP